MKIVVILTLVSFAALVSTAIDKETSLPPLCKVDTYRRTLDCENAGLENFPNVDSRTRKLVLAKNNISHINESLLDNLQELEYLDFSQNKLKSLDEFTVASLTSLLHLKISSNPFKCDCRIEWLRKELKGHFRKHRFSILNGSGVSCVSPENVAAKLVSRINITLSCDSENCKNFDTKFSEHVVCDEHAVCTMLDQRYKCECKTGYKGDGLSCSDINECSNSKHHDCHSNASCINTPGSYMCQCMSGYYGDGRLSCLAFKNVTAHFHRQQLSDSMVGNIKDRRAERIVEITIIAGSFALVTLFVVLIFVCL